MRLALLATLSTSLLAAACADDSHESATFATATDTQLLRVADVARFRDAGLMFEVADALFGANSAGCPAVSTTGQVTTVTTDCTTDCVGGSLTAIPSIATALLLVPLIAVVRSALVTSPLVPSAQR